MATADRVLSVLGLFTLDRPEWTVEAIASELKLSTSTAYQYVGSLVKAGLLVASKTSRYTIGPAAIELDRVARQVDPLARHGRSVLRELVTASGAGTIGLLCRLYRLRVMCVDQYATQPPEIESSYERGRPMPLIRGSASKAILANLPARTLRRLYDAEADALARADLGDDWRTFKEAMRRIRRAGTVVSIGELDAGAMGISAPVFDEDDAVLGSIGLVLAAAPTRANPDRLDQLRTSVENASAAVTRNLRTR